MIIVDATIVNVAIPSMIDDLGITSTQAQWIQEIYTLVFAALLLACGRLADAWGRRLIFSLGAVVFVVASVLAALAPTGEVLIGARAVQGVGGAMMLPSSLSLLNAGFAGKERALAFAFWGATIGGMAALGPLLGGWLTTDFSWRYAFGVNVPLGLAVIVGAIFFIAESRDRLHGRGIDGFGAVLATFGFAGIVFGLIEGRTLGWWTANAPIDLGGLTWSWDLSPVPVAFALGLAALTAFVLVERRRNRTGRACMLDLDLFAIRSFRNGNLAAGIVSLGEFGLIFTLPLWFQSVRGLSAFETGLALLPLALGSFAASGLQAAVLSRYSPILAVRVGIGLEFCAVLGFAIWLGSDASLVLTSALLAGYGVGVGLATAQLTGVVLADVPRDSSGQASGTQSTSRQVGSALGIAILGTVLFSTLGHRFADALGDIAGLPASAANQLVELVKQTAGTAIPQLANDPRGAQVAALARDAFTDATRTAAAVAAAFLLIGFVASWFLTAKRPAAADEAATD